VALAAILQYNAARGLLNLVQCGPPACLSLRPLALMLDRWFFWKPFPWKFIVTPPPPTGGVRGLKNWLRCLVNPVRSGQIRKAIKSLIIWPPGPPPFYVHFTKFRKRQQKRGYPRSASRWKNGLRIVLNPVRFKKFKNWTPGVPNPFVRLFRTEIRRNVFWKMLFF
jgi:hypothetical protein